jgi:hypothetical protein
VPLQLIGAGWSRTGTTSLQAALDVFGMRTFEIGDVFADLDRAALFTEALDDPGFDWERLFAGFDAAADQPAHVFWRELAAFYPDAKVVLTVRDAAEWYASYRATIWGPTIGRAPADERWREMVRRVLVERAYGGEPTDRDHVIATYERHNDDVRSAFGPDRLLVLDLAEGWEPLCRFLGRPVPDAPFPHLNRRDEWPS